MNYMYDMHDKQLLHINDAEKSFKNDLQGKLLKTIRFVVAL